MKYCCHSGLSSPSWRLSVATFCGVALGPRMVSVGLPGSKWTRKKVTIETKMMMMTSSTNRFEM